MTETIETTARELTPELADLMEHEKAIEHSLVDLGWHLQQIRDEDKYTAAGYTRFEDYCRERWSFGRRYVNQQIKAAATIREIAGMGAMAPIDDQEGQILPTTERQTRPLTKLDTPQEKAEAWADAVESSGGQPTGRDVQAAVEKIKPPKPKPVAAEPQPADEGTQEDIAVQPQRSDHPATYSRAILDVFARHLEPHTTVLDPFAGVGGIHQLSDRVDVKTIGVEIEPEWAEQGKSLCGDSRQLDYLIGAKSVDVIATSPAYGNRMADHHDAKDDSHRNTYRHTLGRELTEGNAGGMQWGDEYRELHADVWAIAVTRLKPGGKFLLNIKDHVRAGEVQQVAAWHVDQLCRRIGLELVAKHFIASRGLPSGENAEERVHGEEVFVFVKPLDWSAAVDDTEPPAEHPEELALEDDEVILTEPEPVPDGPPWSSYDVVGVARLIKTITQMDDRTRLAKAALWEVAHRDRDEVVKAIDVRLGEIEAERVA